MLFIICVNRHLRLFCNCNLMVCLFQELKRGKFIRGLLVGNLKSTEKVKIV